MIFALRLESFLDRPGGFLQEPVGSLQGLPGPGAADNQYDHGWAEKVQGNAFYFGSTIKSITLFNTDKL